LRCKAGGEPERYRMNKRILVVEDQEDLRGVLRDLLTVPFLVR